MDFEPAATSSSSGPQFEPAATQPANNFTGQFDPKEFTRQEAIKRRIDPELATRLIGHESSWNANAQPKDPKTEKLLSSAYGYGQLLKGTAEGLGVNPKDPRQNITGSLDYLKQQLDEFGLEGVPAYHMGPNAYRRMLAIGGSFPEATQGWSNHVLGGYKGNGYYTPQSQDGMEFEAATPQFEPAASTEGLATRAGKALSGTLAGTADFVGSMVTGGAGGILASSQYIGDSIKRGIDFVFGSDFSKGESNAAALQRATKIIEKSQEYNPSVLATKLGVPEELVNNWASKATSRPFEVLSKNADEISEWLGGAPSVKAFNNTLIQAFVTAVALHSIGKVGVKLDPTTTAGERALKSARDSYSGTPGETPPPGGGPINPEQPATKPWGTPENNLSLAPQEVPRISEIDAQGREVQGWNMDSSTDALTPATVFGGKLPEDIELGPDRGNEPSLGAGGNVGGKTEPAMGTGEVPPGQEHAPITSNWTGTELRTEPTMGEKPKSETIPKNVQQHVMEITGVDWEPEDMGKPRGPQDIVEPRTDINKVKTPEELEQERRMRTWQDEMDQQYADWKAQQEVLKDEGRRATESEPTEKPDLSLEEKSKAEERVGEREKLWETRSEWPVSDIRLLPEAAQKDGVITREHNKALAAETKLEELKQEAQTIGLEVRGKEKPGVKPNAPKVQTERLKALEAEIKEEENKRDKARDHVTTRLENKYNINFSKVENTGSIYQKSTRARLPIEEPDKPKGTPPWEGESTADRLTRLLKTDTPPMQRDATSSVTNTAPITRSMSLSDRRGPGGRQGGGSNFGAADLVAKALEALFKGAKQTMVTAHQFLNDRRSAIELIEGMKQRAASVGKSLKELDLGDWTSEFYKNFTSSKGASILAQKYGPAGDLVKWVSDQLRGIDRKTNNRTLDAMFGSEFGKKWTALGRPFDVRLKGLNGVFDPWRKMTKRDIAYMHQSALNAMRGGYEPTREHFNNDIQYEAYKSIRTAMNKVLDAVNEARAKVGLPPIKPLPGYLPTRVRGDYKVVFRNDMGEVKHISGHNFKWGATRLIAEMKKQFPELKAELVLISKAKDRYSDLASFEHTMNLLDKADPATVAVHKAYVKLLTSRGFGAHSLHRKGGWEGFEGSAESYKGAKEMRDSVEDYINRGFQYAGGLEKSLVLRDLLDAGETKYKSWYDSETGEFRREGKGLLETEMPNTFGVIQDIISHSRGGTKESTGYEEKLLMKYSEMIGLGANAPIKAIKAMGNFGIFTWLTKPSFVLNQGIQPANAIARMVKAKYLEHNFGDVTTSVLAGYKNIVAPDASAIAGVNWAIKNNYLTSQVLDMFDGVHSWKHTSDSPLTTFKKFISQMPIGKMEQELVRTPVFLMFEHGYRKSIPDAAKRYEVAAEMTHHYMVDYSRQERAQVFDKMGVLGHAFSGLKAYSINWWTQMFEYLGDLKKNDPKSYLPFGTFMVNGFLQAGIKGLPLMAEATAAVMAYNYITSQNVPTPERLVFEAGSPDLITFGGASTLTGVDILSGNYDPKKAVDMSNSLSAPTMKSMVASPAFSAGADLWQGAHTAIDMLQGQATDAQKYTAEKNLLPSGLTGAVEQQWSPNGKDVPYATDSGMKTDYTRNLTQWFIRKYIGYRSVDEAKKGEMMHELTYESEQEQKVRGKLATVLADQVFNHQPLDRDLINKYVKDMHGDPKQLPTEIMDKMKGRIIDRLTNIVLQGQGLEKAQKLSKIQKLTGLLDHLSDRQLVELNDRLDKQNYTK